MQNYKQVNDYITDICDQIRSKRAHYVVAREINDHIEDQKNAFVLDGQDEETAINNVIKEMGDPVVVGEQLDKIHRPKPEKSIIATVIILVILQIISTAFLKHINFELNEYIISLAIGIAVMTLVYFIDYSRIVKYSTLIYIFLSLFNILTDKVGFRVFSVSLDYYFSLIMIVVFSGVLVNFRNKGYKGYIACILLLLLGIFTMIKIGSISCLLIFFIGAVILFLTACLKNIFKTNKKVTVTLFVGAVILIGILILFKFLTMMEGGSYVFDRFMSILSPYSDPNGYGYIKVFIRELLAKSSFIGEALMPERYSTYSLSDMPPNIPTDYQLAYFIARFGYIVGIVVILIIAFLILRMFISTFKQKNQQGMFISLGCSIVILIQAAFYIMANLGYEIVGTISLPLLSYGKAGFIVNMLIIGIMLCTYRNDTLVERK